MRLFFKRRHFLVLFSLALFVPRFSDAQVRTPPGWYHDPKPHSKIRVLLSKVNVEITPGYTRTFYTHNLEGQALYSGTEGVRVFQASDYNSGTNTISGGLTQWVNTSQGTGAFNVSADDFLVSSDTAKLKMRNTSLGFPLSITAFIRIYRFKIGGGYWIQPEFIGKFDLLKFPDPQVQYDPDIGFIFLRKWYGMVGGDIIRFGDWVVSADLRVGGWNPGKKFNLTQIEKGVFFNVGGGVEWDIAEYFRVYGRPSFEVRSYTLSIPETSGTLRHWTNNLNLQVGAIVRLPEKRRCKIKLCQVQMDHQHGDREYRTRMFPIWKKQNPNYGENYPRLLKDKGKNRNKKYPF